MAENLESENGVNGAGVLNEGLSLCRCPVEEQRRLGRHQVTVLRVRRKWTSEDNERVMECYYSS